MTTSIPTGYGPSESRPHSWKAAPKTHPLPQPSSHRTTVLRHTPFRLSSLVCTHSPASLALFWPGLSKLTVPLFAEGGAELHTIDELPYNQGAYNRVTIAEIGRYIIC